jgi:hypothetical protein
LQHPNVFETPTDTIEPKLILNVLSDWPPESLLEPKLIPPKLAFIPNPFFTLRKMAGNKLMAVVDVFALLNLELPNKP